MAQQNTGEKKAGDVVATASVGSPRSMGRGLRKYREGIVIENKMAKTLVVEVHRLEKHPLYGKFMRRSSTHYVHDEKAVGAVGDTVRIEATRPLSRLKRWKLASVVRKAS